MAKKAQMFVITMVFLAGLAFFVHQLLIKYSDVDLSALPKNDDYYIVKNVADIVNESIQTSETCEDALSVIRELDRNVEKLEGNYIIKINYNKKNYPNLNCNAFTNSTGNMTALLLDIHVLSPMSETESSFAFYK